MQALAARIEQGYGGGADAVGTARHRAPPGADARRAQPDDAGRRVSRASKTRIDELSRKMDGFGGNSPDPETLRYLEAAINELRELSAGVASAEGVASIAGDVQALGARIDHLAVVSGASGARFAGATRQRR